MQKTKQQTVFASNLFIGALIYRDDKFFIVDNIDSTLNKGVVSAILCDLETGFSKIEEFSMRSKVIIVEYKEQTVEYMHPSASGDGEIFFDITSLEQVDIEKSLCTYKMCFIRNAVLYTIISQNEVILGIVLPRFVEIEVKSIVDSSEDSALDGRSGRSFIKVELETGHIISVPSFIERSDIIKIDTRKQTFVQRF